MTERQQQTIIEPTPTITLSQPQPRPRPSARQLREPLTRRPGLTIAGIVLTGLVFAGSFLISSAVILVFPALALGRLVQTRGLRASRGPLLLAIPFLAIVIAATVLGLPPIINILAILVFVLLARRTISGGSLID
jgi:hypothetical protein